ncbi:MAG TPA: aminotransferase class III-fold pyridoxal phosphate-dependent enzyme [Vicinamibacterales bacterium]|nr:aminotransferase class III-fold pyridoxal phosphate-dependent enzyme [Vicinamibacterales bacterium]
MSDNVATVPQVRYHAPTLSIDDAANVAKDRYGLVGVTIEPLPSERDQNFHIVTGGSESFVLKISHRDESRDSVELQARVLIHLRARVPELLIPRVVPTLSGETLTTIAGPEEAAHLMRMVTFVPGEVWAKVAPRSDGMLRSLGRALALVDAALSDYPATGVFGDLKWDLTQAGWIRDYLQYLPADRKNLVERIFERYESHAAPRLATLPSGLLYNDANDHNVLVAGDRVVSLIDFGDMVHGPRVCDLAIGIAYAIMGSSTPLAAAADVVSGYHEAMPLTEAELEVLYPLVCARLCVSVTNSAYQRHAAPDNPYLQVSDRPAWELLDILEHISPRHAIDAFRSACGFTPWLSDESLLSARQTHLSPNLSLAYRTPLHIVRGHLQYLYDADGREYIDAVNNVAHVGHCHPRVVRAGQEQMATLNTNSRYLHSHIVRYAERLCATLPEPLRVCFFVNSGSEACDLALRLARTHTGSRATVVIDGAYHGNSSELVRISPYKYDGPGGAGPPDYVRKVATPHTYRGWNGHTGVPEAIEDLTQTGHSRPAFIAESLMGSCGQIVLPPGFLDEAFRQTRAAGGVCIADEVQVGFGRVGTHFWGFETQDVVPDIVVMGKPMGNGHPIGAVVTTAEIAASFNNGMEYFSTFGGNPVSCAIGLAVLDVIHDEGLQEKALHVGEHLRQGFRELASHYAIIGDVRGLGLFIGVEFVCDRATLAPAPEATTYVCNRLMEQGILVSVDGPRRNVLKIKPPLVFSDANVARFVETLDRILSEDPAQP